MRTEYWLAQMEVRRRRQALEVRMLPARRRVSFRKIKKAIRQGLGAPPVDAKEKRS